MGWRFGWLAKDIQKPSLSSVWRPSYFAVNALSGSEFSYAFGGNKPQCYAKRRAGSFPPSLIVALLIALILVVAVFSICLSSKKNKKPFRISPY
jgi:hypothetical protein